MKNETQERKQKILAEQIRLLYKKIPIVNIGGYFTITLITLFFKQENNNAILYFISALITICTTFNIVMFDRTSVFANLKLWEPPYFPKRFLSDFLSCKIHLFYYFTQLF